MDECTRDHAKRSEDGDARERCARRHGEVLHFLLCLFADEGGDVGAVECLCVLEVNVNGGVATKVLRLFHLRDRALAARALREDEDIADEYVICDLILDGVADLEVFGVDGGHERDLNERVRGDGDGGDGDFLRAEGCLREGGDALLECALGGFAEEGDLHLADAFLHGAQTRLVIDVPLDRVEVHEDGRACAVCIDLVVDRVNPRHEAACTVFAVIVAFELVDAVYERARLLLSVGILLDEREF